MENNLKEITNPYNINDDFTMFYKGLLECKNVKNITIYKLNINSVIIRLELKINLPSRRSLMEFDIKEFEPIKLLCSTNEIKYKAPLVFSDRNDFPVEKLPHTLAMGLNYSYICLHRGNIDDWYIDHSVEDFVNRIRFWFSDAACNNLIKPGDDFEPMINYTETGNIVYSYNKLTKFIEEYWSNNNEKNGFAYAMCCFNNKEESEHLNINEESFSVQILEVFEKENLTSLLQKLNRERIKNKNVFLGIVGWGQKNSKYNEYFKLINITLEELYEFNKKIGIDLKRALNILKDKKIPNIIALISAINRPSKVIGFEKNIEFINFLFKIKKVNEFNVNKIKEDGKALVVKHLEPLTRNLAANISTLSCKKNPKILFVGAGALGSKIIFHLARNGYTDISVVDNDILVPHNLVRHALFADSISKNKAKEIINKLNNIYIMDKNKNFKYYSESFINFAINTDLSIYDVLIDCSASKSVFSFISEYSKKLPALVIRAELANKGKLGLVLKENINRNLKIDDIQVSLFNYALSNTEVAEWLKNYQNLKENFEGAQFEDITIGMGCNTNTMKISDNIISYHAAIFSSYIKKHITNDIQNGEFLISYFDENNLSENYCKIISVQDFISVNTSENNWTTKIYRKAYERILNELNNSKPNETGGILLGNINKNNKTIYVTDIYIPKDSKYGPYLFTKGSYGTKEYLEHVLKSTGNIINYVGDWHTHPESSTNMSSKDKKSLLELKEYLKEYSYPAHIMIFNEKDISSYVIS
ncbi:thiamine biosynthesis protein ThiF [Clostridium perfringens]